MLPSVKPKYVKATLASLRPTLDVTSERILAAIKPVFRSEALALLRWLAYAESPLSLDELVEVAIIDPEGEEIDMDEENRGDLEGTLNILSELVTLSGLEDNFPRPVALGKEGGDVEAARDQHLSGKMTLRLAHFSVQEYLESSRILDSEAREFHLKLAPGHCFLAQSCLAYLAHYSKVEDKILKLKEDSKRYPLLRYAARWWYHPFGLQKSPESDRVISLLTSKEATFHWLRAHRESAPHALKVEVWDLKSPERLAPSLYYASILGLENVVGVLLAAGADVDALGGLYGTPLQAAVAEGYDKVVRKLLDAGADVNRKVLRSFFGFALLAAASRRHKRVVQALIDAGVDVNAGDGITLVMACDGHHDELVGLLLDTGADPNGHGQLYDTADTVLQSAVVSRSTDTIRRLLEAGADVNAQGTNGSALYRAIGAGRDNVVQMLIDAGADVNGPGRGGDLPLNVACRSGSKKVVRLLLDAGVDVNGDNGGASDALQEASMAGKEEIMQMLLAAGADIGRLAASCDETTAAAPARRRAVSKTSIVSLVYRRGNPSVSKGLPFRNVRNWSNVW